MDWIHQINPPRDFIEFEFLDSSGHFLKQYCNHEIYNIIKIIELGAPINNNLQNI